jgi:hypothetical protein
MKNANAKHVRDHGETVETQDKKISPWMMMQKIKKKSQVVNTRQCAEKNTVFVEIQRISGSQPNLLRRREHVP